MIGHPERNGMLPVKPISAVPYAVGTNDVDLTLLFIASGSVNLLATEHIVRRFNVQLVNASNGLLIVTGGNISLNGNPVVDTLLLAPGESVQLIARGGANTNNLWWGWRNKLTVGAPAPAPSPSPAPGPSGPEFFELYVDNPSPAQGQTVNFQLRVRNGTPGNYMVSVNLTPSVGLSGGLSGTQTVSLSIDGSGNGTIGLNYTASGIGSQSLTATLYGSTRTTNVTVGAAALVFSSFSRSASSVVVGGQVTGTILLTGGVPNTSQTIPVEFSTTAEFGGGTATVNITFNFNSSGQATHSRNWIAQTEGPFGTIGAVILGTTRTITVAVVEEESAESFDGMEFMPVTITQGNSSTLRLYFSSLPPSTSTNVSMAIGVPGGLSGPGGINNFNVTANAFGEGVLDLTYVGISAGSQSVSITAFGTNHVASVNVTAAYNPVFASATFSPGSISQGQTTTLICTFTGMEPNATAFIPTLVISGVNNLSGFSGTQAGLNINADSSGVGTFSLPYTGTAAGTGALTVTCLSQTRNPTVAIAAVFTPTFTGAAFSPASIAAGASSTLTLSFAGLPPSTTTSVPYFAVRTPNLTGTTTPTIDVVSDASGNGTYNLTYTGVYQGAGNVEITAYGTTRHAPLSVVGAFVSAAFASPSETAGQQEPLVLNFSGLAPSSVTNISISITSSSGLSVASGGAEGVSNYSVTANASGNGTVTINYNCLYAGARSVSVTAQGTTHTAPITVIPALVSGVLSPNPITVGNTSTLTLTLGGFAPGSTNPGISTSLTPSAGLSGPSGTSNETFVANGSGVATRTFGYTGTSAGARSVGYSVAGQSGTANVTVNNVAYTPVFSGLEMGSHPTNPSNQVVAVAHFTGMEPNAVTAVSLNVSVSSDLTSGPSGSLVVNITANSAGEGDWVATHPVHPMTWDQLVNGPGTLSVTAYGTTRNAARPRNVGSVVGANWSAYGGPNGFDYLMGPASVLFNANGNTSIGNGHPGTATAWWSNPGSAPTMYMKYTALTLSPETTFGNLAAFGAPAAEGDWFLMSGDVSLGVSGSATVGPNAGIFEVTCNVYFSPTGSDGNIIGSGSVKLRNRTMPDGSTP